MNTETIFNNIQTFVEELGECYSEENKPLALYQHLLSKTDSEHTGAINKHISIFKNFVVTNVVAIESNNIEQFKEPIIKYSDKVYIDILDIINKASDSDKQVIWKHLLVLSALLDKNSISKNILKSKMQEEEQAEPVDCSGFITDMVDNVAKKLELPEDKDNMDIGQIMNKMVSSGAITDIFQGVQQGLDNGQLDLAGLMSSAQTMLNTDSPEGAPNMGDMVNTVMSSLSGAGIPGLEGGNNDMMNMVMGMMNNFQPPQQPPPQS